MKKIISLCTLVLSLLVFSMAANAQDFKELILTNHFDQDLYLQITINPQVLPDLPKEGFFTLKSGEFIKTRLMDIGKQAYIRVVDDTSVSRPKSAFWGVNIDKKTHEIMYHSYIKYVHGIDIKYQGNTVTFIKSQPHQH